MPQHTKTFITKH